LFTLTPSFHRHSFRTIVGLLLVSCLLTQSAVSLAKTVSTRPAVHKPGIKTGSVSKPKSVNQHVNSANAKVNPNAFIPYYNQGRDAYKLEHYAEAEKLLKKSLVLAEQGASQMYPGLQQKNIAIIHNLLGVNAFKLKKYNEACLYLKRAMNTYNRPEYQAANEDSLMSDALILGQIAMYEGRYDEAKLYYQEALPRQEKILGLDHAQTRQTQSILEDIARIDQGSDYLDRLGRKVIHWTHPEQSIKVFIANDSSMPGWKPEDQALVQAAYAEWQLAMENRVRFEFVSEPAEADTIVSWMERPKAVTPAEAEAKQQELRNGECQTQTVDDKLAQDNIVVALNSTEGTPASANSIYNTLLHEIGHSLGLMGGHSSNPADILFPNNRYDDGRRKHLSQRDIQTARRLYVLQPDVTNPEGIHLVRYYDYTTLATQGKEAYNHKAYPEAVNDFQKALAIYNAEPEIRFFLGASLYLQQAYAGALPYLMASASVPGKYQDEALKLTGHAFIKMGEIDDKAGARSLAEQKYQRAYQILNQGLQTLAMKPENKNAILQELSWLNNRLSIPSDTPIQWASQDTRQITNQDQANNPKKRGWFSTFVSSFSASAAPIQGPTQ